MVESERKHLLLQARLKNISRLDPVQRPFETKVGFSNPRFLLVIKGRVDYIIDRSGGN